MYAASTFMFFKEIEKNEKLIISKTKAKIVGTTFDPPSLLEKANTQAGSISPANIMKNQL
jgi:hypothetical protein